MSHRMPVVVLVAGLAVVFVSCMTAPNASYAPPPLPPDGGVPFINDDEAAAARMVFIAKCTRCHKFHDPANYSEADWNKWFTKMSKKAKLEPNQKELLSRYLEVFRASATNSSHAVIH